MANVRLRFRPGDDPAARGLVFKRDSVATYFDAEGVMRVGPAGWLRTNHVSQTLDQYRNKPAFLIEGKRMNLFRNTDDVVAAVAGGAGSTVDGWALHLAGSSLDPITGGKLAPDLSPAGYLKTTALGVGLQGQTPNFPLEAGTFLLTSSMWLCHDDGGSTWEADDWYLTAGEASGYYTRDAKIVERAPGGWFRVAVTWEFFNGAPSGALNLSVYLRSRRATPQGIFFAKPQLEWGAFASSYIPSPAAGFAVREADVLSFEYPDVPESIAVYTKFLRPENYVMDMPNYGVANIGTEPSLFTVGDLKTTGSEFRAYFEAPTTGSPTNPKNRKLVTEVRAGSTVSTSAALGASDKVIEHLAQLEWSPSAGSAVRHDFGAGPTAYSAETNGVITQWAQPILVLGRSGADADTSFFGNFFELKLMTGFPTMDEARKLISLSHSYIAPWMYAKVPEVARDYDRLNNYELQQLLSVLSIGFAEVHESIQNFANLIDPEVCEDWALPRLAAQLGFEFPYDIPVSQQRAFVRFMVNLYRVKGTPFGMKLAALRLVGNGFDVAVTNEDVVAKTFTVEVTANGDSTALLAELTKKLNYIVTQHTPAGMVGVTIVIYYFTDAIDNLRQADDHVTTESSLWRWSVPYHRLADNMKYAEYGTLTLAI